MATAADRHLERIIAAERQLGVVRMCGARSLSVTAFVILLTVTGLLSGAAQRSQLAVVLLLVYLGLCLLLVILVTRRPSATGWVALTVPLVDVPLVVAFSALAPGPAPYTFVMPIAALSAYIVFAAVSLSRGLLTGTYVSALIGGALLYALDGASLVEQVKVTIVPGGIYLVCLYLVTRLRVLVAESRSDDLIGKYILGERLGMGGMAEVFKATYCPEGGFERPVAVKRVLPHLATDPQFIERFRREAELTARLVHPNIVQVLDFGRHRDSYFLAMEWVDGAPLSRLVREPLPVAAVSWLGLQLAEALDYIHARRGPDGAPLGLVHRDMNPPNVLVSRLGEVKLTDFGVARASSVTSLTQTGAVVGKLVYMAPEQVQGLEYDGRADLFALGLTLHEALTGRRLLQGSTDAQAMQALLTGQFAAPSATMPDVPPVLDAVVMGLLERDVGQRVPSGMAVKLALMQFGGAASPFPDGQRLLAEAVNAVPVEPLREPAGTQTVTTPQRGGVLRRSE